MKRFQILICDGPSCGVTHDSDRLVDLVESARASDPELASKLEVARFTCFDHCDDGPNLFVRGLASGETPGEPDSAVFCAQRGFYDHMDEARLGRVLEEHVKGGEPVEDLVGEY